MPGQPACPTYRPSFLIFELIGPHGFSGRRVQEQIASLAGRPEIEHLHDGAGDIVKGTLTNSFSLKPVDFDKAYYGRLIGDGVVDKVWLCPGGNHQEGLAWPVTAPSLRMWVVVGTRKSRVSMATGSHAGEHVGGTGGLIDDRRHLVVIPAVGVVIEDYDGGTLPLRFVFE